MVTLAVLLMRRSALGVTVKDAVTVVVLLPTEVASDPGGIVLVPLCKPVTTTDTEHDAPGGITVPVPTTNELAPGVAVKAGLAQVLVTRGDAELLISAG